VGRRRGNNEDAFLVATLQRALLVHDASPGARGWFAGERAGTLLVVADGMGGQGGGDLASRTAVETVTKYLLNCMPWAKAHEAEASTRSSLTGIRDQLSSALLAGDERVRREGAQTGTPRMGTTLTMALIMDSILYVAHVGDTRCYLLQGGQLRRLTKDHNLAQLFADESAKPVEPPETLQNMLWNALGATEKHARPDVSKLELEPGAVVLLCSDGLNKHVPDAQIENVLKNGESCAARATMLVGLANAAGGSDNITAIVADIRAA
jgi:serine/threonine protein phosphatase PrpC